MPAQYNSVRRDFDGDGKSDVFLRNPTTGANYLWKMDANQVTNSSPLLEAVAKG